MPFNKVPKNLVDLARHPEEYTPKQAKAIIDDYLRDGIQLTDNKFYQIVINQSRFSDEERTEIQGRVKNSEQNEGLLRYSYSYRSFQ